MLQLQFDNNDKVARIIILVTSRNLDILEECFLILNLSVHVNVLMQYNLWDIENCFNVNK